MADKPDYPQMGQLPPDPPRRTGLDLGEGELDKESNMQKMHIANSDKPVALYNLEVVISLFFFFIAQRPTAAGRTQRPVRRGGQADKRTGGHVSFFRMIIETFISFVSFILIILEFYLNKIHGYPRNQ